MSRFLEDAKLDKIVNDLPECIISKKTLRLLFKKQYIQRSAPWLAKRQGILTASDCASALGLNKYQSRSDLILKKAGLNKDSNNSASDNQAMNHGIQYEDEAADIYRCQNPHLAPFFEIGLVMHEKHSFLGASPDRVTKDGILIEIKVKMLFLESVYVYSILFC
tara:strand:- start:8643 stop:9134 length:492 start_codon:yes stop_codon:yes gene_type:complete